MAKATSRKFTTQLQSDGGKVRLYLPFDPHEVWGKQNRHRVKGKLGGAELASSIGAGGGKFFIPINRTVLAASGVKPGDRVTVELEPDREGEEVSVPPDLEQAMARDRKAREFFSGLSPFYRKQYASWVEDAKRPETRAARVDKVVAFLAEGRKQRR